MAPNRLTEETVRLPERDGLTRFPLIVVVPLKFPAIVWGSKKKLIILLTSSFSNLIWPSILFSERL